MVILCYFCGFEKRNINRLAEHMRSKHTQERPLKCEQCAKTFASTASLRSHKQCHRTSEKVQCLQCPKSFNNKVSLRIHVRNTHGVQHYECNECNYKTFTNIRLRIHSRTHAINRKRQFACEMCKQGFFTKSDLNKHLMTHITDRKQWACYFCSKVYISMTGLHGHLRFHTNELWVDGAEKKCSECTGVFANKKELRKHFWNEHARQRTHTCNICGYKTELTGNFKRHVATHSSLRPFQCSLCPATFKVLIRLQSHIKVVHFGVKDYSCNKCPKMFLTPNLLQNHVLLKHSLVKPFACAICGNRYGSRKSVNEHIKSKHEPKGYLCYFCRRPFTRLDSFHIHLFTHTKERHLKCDLNVEGTPCRYESSNNRALQHHIRVVHEGFRVRCSLCSFSATVKNALFSHITTTHTRERHVKCVQCGRRFSDRKELRTHPCLST